MIIYRLCILFLFEGTCYKLFNLNLAVNILTLSNFLDAVYIQFLMVLIWSICNIRPSMVERLFYFVIKAFDFTFHQLFKSLLLLLIFLSCFWDNWLFKLHYWFYLQILIYLLNFWINFEWLSKSTVLCYWIIALPGFY